MYTNHHFGGGRVLEPGHSSFALGAGYYPSMSYGCGQNAYFIKTSAGQMCEDWGKVYFDSSGRPFNRVDTMAAERATNYGYAASLGWRLGLAGRIGPFPGVELGIHLEAPTNPVTAEFDLKIGLPAPAGRFRHALAAGWGIGMWADNTWFGEYAASADIGRHSLFGNYRGTWLATQIYDFDDPEGRRRFNSRHRFIHQGALGFAWKPGPGWPEILAPLVLATYPQAPYGEEEVPAYLLREVAWNLGFGMRWGLR